MKTLNDNQDGVRKAIKEFSEMQLKSNLSFLNNHNGLRFGHIHTLMAGSGVGKSTLIRTLINDILDANGASCPRVCLWLSEETKLQFQAQFFKGIDMEDKFSMVDIESEMDCDAKTRGVKFTEMISSCDVFIFDNLTTSAFYNDKKPSEQGAVLTRIKQIALEKNICCILVVHADGKFSESDMRVLSMNDVRGSKTVVNISEFFYILQSVFIGRTQVTFLSLKKHRNQEADNKYFILPYEKSLAIYRRDIPIEYDEILELFESANKIKKDKKNKGVK